MDHKRRGGKRRKTTGPRRRMSGIGSGKGLLKFAMPILAAAAGAGAGAFVTNNLLSKVTALADKPMIKNLIPVVGGAFAATMGGNGLYFGLGMASGGVLNAAKSVIPGIGDIMESDINNMMNGTQIRVGDIAVNGVMVGNTGEVDSDGSY